MVLKIPIATGIAGGNRWWTNRSISAWGKSKTGSRRPY